MPGPACCPQNEKVTGCYLVLVTNRSVARYSFPQHCCPIPESGGPEHRDQQAQDLVEAFTAMEWSQVGALLVGADPHVLEPNLARVVAVARIHRLPAMYPRRFYVVPAA
jgi:hypothetical protein